MQRTLTFKKTTELNVIKNVHKRSWVFMDSLLGKEVIFLCIHQLLGLARYRILENKYLRRISGKYVLQVHQRIEISIFVNNYFLVLSHRPRGYPKASGLGMLGLLETHYRRNSLLAEVKSSSSLSIFKARLKGRAHHSAS